MLFNPLFQLTLRSIISYREQEARGGERLVKICVAVHIKLIVSFLISGKC